MAAEKGLAASEKLRKRTSGAEARVDSIAVYAGMNPRPTARISFSATGRANIDAIGAVRGVKTPPPSDSNL